MQIDDVRNAHHEQDEHLLADALEADGAGQLLVHDGAHHARDRVANHRGLFFPDEACHTICSDEACHTICSDAACFRNVLPGQQK